MRRREFIGVLGGAAVSWPVTARAQQPAMPVIGYLNYGSPESDTFRLTGLRRGLNETGYIEGRNLMIEYRWAGNQADRLPALATDLVQLRVAVIVTPGFLPALAAKAATITIPIVFNVSAYPVQLGLVASLNRPGGNVTGFNNFGMELGTKALALLHELVPGIQTIGFLENPRNPASELATKDVTAAASALGLKIHTLKAETDREIDAAFVNLVQARAGALFVGPDLHFNIESRSSLHLRYDMRSRPCTRSASSLWRAGSSVTGPTCQKLTDRSGCTRVAFSRVKARPTCRSYSPRKLS
jgi:putative ABC transport system substrate-binding protein